MIARRKLALIVSTVSILALSDIVVFFVFGLPNELVTADVLKSTSSVTKTESSTPNTGTSHGLKSTQIPATLLGRFTAVVKSHWKVAVAVSVILVVAVALAVALSVFLRSSVVDDVLPQQDDDPTIITPTNPSELETTETLSGPTMGVIAFVALVIIVVGTFLYFKGGKKAQTGGQGGHVAQTEATTTTAIGQGGQVSTTATALDQGKQVANPEATKAAPSPAPKAVPPTLPKGSPPPPKAQPKPSHGVKWNEFFKNSLSEEQLNAADDHDLCAKKMIVLAACAHQIRRVATQNNEYDSGSFDDGVFALLDGMVALYPTFDFETVTGLSFDTFRQFEPSDLSSHLNNIASALVGPMSMVTEEASRKFIDFCQLEFTDKVQDPAECLQKFKQLDYVPGDFGPEPIGFGPEHGEGDLGTNPWYFGDPLGVSDDSDDH